MDAGTYTHVHTHTHTHAQQTVRGVREVRFYYYAPGIHGTRLNWVVASLKVKEAG